MRLITALILIATGAASSYLILSHNGKEASPPKQIQPAQVQSAQPAIIVAEGRIAAYPGANVVVASETPGIISAVRMHELDVVQKGQVLADLRKSDLLAEREEALAKVKEAEADIRLAGSENLRTQQLVERQFISRQGLDRTERDLSAAQARLSVAQAAVKRLSAQIEKTRIIAPINGTVVIRHVDEGEAVAPGGAVATLADLSRLRVEAEVDEFDIGRIRIGDQVSISAEGYDGSHWLGKVEELPDAVRERGMRPQDVARPSDARILLVKVALQEHVPLKLGQRVEVVISPANSRLSLSGAEKISKKTM